MPRRNRLRPVGRLDRTAPRSTRPRGTGPARHCREPAVPVDYQLAVHGYLVIAVHGQLGQATAAQPRLAIIVIRGGYPTPGPLDPTLATRPEVIGLGAPVTSCLICTGIGVRITVDDPSRLIAQLLYLADIPAP